VINEYELERMRALVGRMDGRHSDAVLKAIMKEYSCGPVRAGHLLHEAVRAGVARLDGLKVRKT